jgi:hypothetical protein
MTDSILPLCGNLRTGSMLDALAVRRRELYGGRPRACASRSREVGDLVLVKTERQRNCSTSQLLNFVFKDFPATTDLRQYDFFDRGRFVFERSLESNAVILSNLESAGKSRSMFHVQEHSLVHATQLRAMICEIFQPLFERAHFL